MIFWHNVLIISLGYNGERPPVFCILNWKITGVGLEKKLSAFHYQYRSQGLREWTGLDECGRYGREGHNGQGLRLFALGFILGL
jgi:hypothetical protein